MRTILDEHSELILLKVVDEDLLACEVKPAAHQPGRHIGPDPQHFGFILKFDAVFGYFVLPELVQVNMGYVYSDNFHYTEIETSPSLKHFDVADLYLSVKCRHMVLRTAHYCVNIFTDSEPEIEIAY